MKEQKLETMSNLFEGNEIRSVWDSNKEDYYFNVVDVIAVLTDNDYQKSRNYWKWLKSKLNNEGSELVSITNQLKMKSTDGKYYNTDVLDTKGILRLIESVPSPKAEPFKLWLAQVGSDRIDEVFDPEKAINRAITYYRNKGYSDDWINARLHGILNRNKLTDAWKDTGITENYEYAILTNEIYKTWSNMTAREYKDLKGIRKESLRDNMTDIEVVLAELGEITTRDIVRKEKPKGLNENIEIAKRGGNVAKIAKENYEKETDSKAISSNNAIGIRYDNNKLE